MPDPHRATLPARSLLACLCLLSGACQAPPPLTRSEVEGVLQAQAERWNRGDLEGFVATYHDGPELTFLGADGLTRGRADLLARYRERYPDAAARGTLRFEVVDFRPLGTDHALLLGRYQLDRQQPASGWFTLVLTRTPDGPVILHDHSTAAH